MAITVYADAILKNNVLSSGANGKNLRMNTRVQMETGVATVNSNWSQSLRQYELASVPRTVDQWNQIIALYEITRGGAYGFLIEDPSDNKVSNTQGKASLVSGATYQLLKRYSYTGSSQTYDRVITRPKTGITVLYNGSPAGSYTLDTTTGQITFTGGPVADASLISWSGDFYVPVHFTNDEIEWNLVAPGPADYRYYAAENIPLSEIRE